MHKRCNFATAPLAKHTKATATTTVAAMIETMSPDSFA